jgi:hypothetical protein
VGEELVRSDGGVGEDFQVISRSDEGVCKELLTYYLGGLLMYSLQSMYRVREEYVRSLSSYWKKSVHDSILIQDHFLKFKATHQNSALTPYLLLTYSLPTPYPT